MQKTRENNGYSSLQEALNAIFTTLIALCIFALVRDEHNAALNIMILIIAALLATYYKLFRDSLKEFF